MSKLVVACSPLTNRIYAGRVNKQGYAFKSKEDVTGMACAAVVHHALAVDSIIVVTANGKPWAEISVKILEQDLG